MDLLILLVYRLCDSRLCYHDEDEDYGVRYRCYEKQNHQYLEQRVR